MIYSVLTIIILLSITIFVTQYKTLRYLRYASLEFFLVGVTISLVPLFFSKVIFNFNIEFFIKVVLGFLAFCIGFSFRFSNFRFNEPIVYKLSLFDIFISLSVFFFVFILMNQFIPNLSEYISIEEIIMLILIYSVSSIGVIIHMNKSISHQSKLKQISFESISFQQFLIYMLFTLVIFLSSKSSLDFYFPNKSFALLIVFLGSIVIAIILYIFVKKLKNITNMISIVLSLISFIIFVLYAFQISSYFPMLIIGLFMGNTLKESTSLNLSFANLKELLFAFINIFAGLLIVDTRFSYPVAAILLIMILLRLLSKFLSQYVSSFFIEYKAYNLKQFNRIFIGHGRLAVALFLMMYLNSSNTINITILICLIISVIIHDYIGQKKYKLLLLEEKYQEDMMETSK